MEGGLSEPSRLFGGRVDRELCCCFILSTVLAIGVWNSGPNGLLISFVVSLVSSMIVVRTVGGAIGVSVLRPDPNQRNVGWG